MNPIKEFQRARAQKKKIFVEAGMMLTCEIKHLHTVANESNCTVSCDLHGSPMTFTPESIRVARYHKGINPLFETQSMSVEIENLIIRAQHNDLEWLELPLPMEEIQTYAGLTHEEIIAKIRLLQSVDLQNGDATDTSDQSQRGNWKVMMHYVSLGLASLTKQNAFPGYSGSMNDIVEGLMILHHWNRACNSVADYWVLARTAYMCFTGKTLSGCGRNTVRTFRFRLSC